MLHFLFATAANLPKDPHRTIIQYDTLSDKMLADRIAAGDGDAFTWLFKKHWKSLRQVVGALLRGDGMTDEIVQETFEVVYKQIGSFRADASLKNWIFKIAVNRTYRVGKKEARQISFSQLGGDDDKKDLMDEFSANGHWVSPVHKWRQLDPQEETINRDGLRQLARFLDQLPEHQRAVVTLRDIEGLEASEICDLLQITPANQRILLHRARTNLRRKLELAQKEENHA